jgi:hypothetical protein
MTDGFIKGLTKDYRGKCNALATKHQSGDSVDLSSDIKRLARDAHEQSRSLGKDGERFLAGLKGQLILAADIAEMPEPAFPDKLTNPTLNLAARSMTYRAIVTELEAAQKQLAQPG